MDKKVLGHQLGFELDNGIELKGSYSNIDIKTFFAKNTTTNINAFWKDLLYGEILGPWVRIHFIIILYNTFDTRLTKAIHILYTHTKSSIFTGSFGWSIVQTSKMEKGNYKRSHPHIFGHPLPYNTSQLLSNTDSSKTQFMYLWNYIVYTGINKQTCSDSFFYSQVVWARAQGFK